MDILDKARELGQMMAESPECIAYKEAEAAQLSDEEAQKLLYAYHVKNQELSKRAGAEGVTKEELEAIQAEAQEEFNKLMVNTSIRNFVEAQKAFSTLLEQVNNIIAYFVKGKDAEGGCGGNCSSCGGCH